MSADIVGVAPAEPIAVVDYRAWCDVWAQDEDGLVLVSFLGPHTVLQALWGQLLAGQTVELEGGTILRRQHGSDGETKVRYQRAMVRFADIEQAHLVLVAEPATLEVGPGQRGYLLSSHERGDLERTFALWNRVVSLPARETWAQFLWEEGLRRGNVRPIAAYGCYAWAIEPETEPWEEIIQGGIEDGILK